MIVAYINRLPEDLERREERLRELVQLLGQKPAIWSFGRAMGEGMSL